MLSLGRTTQRLLRFRPSVVASLSTSASSALSTPPNPSTTNPSDAPQHEQQQKQQQLDRPIQFFKTKRPKYKFFEALDLFRDQFREQHLANPSEPCFVNLDVQLNLDYRIPKQRLKGVLFLPHSTLRPMHVIVHIRHDPLKVECYRNGADVAGDLIQRSKTVDSRKRIFPQPSKNTVLLTSSDFRDSGLDIASWHQTLERRKLLPCAEQQTLVAREQLPRSVFLYSRGYYKPYCSTEHGNLLTVCGSLWEHTNDQLLDNARAILQELFNKRPSSFGHSPDAKPWFRGQYVLSLKLAAPNQPALTIDWNDIDLLREHNVQPGTRDYRARREARRQRRLRAATL